MKNHIHYKKLNDRAISYNGMIHHSQAIIKKYNKIINESFLGKLDDSYTLIASQIAIRNPINGQLELIDGQYRMNLRTLNERSNEIVQRMCNFYCSQVYEAFETFLIDLSIDVIKENSDSIIRQKLDFSSELLLRKSFKRKYQKNEEKIKLLSSLSNVLQDLQKNNYNSFHYDEWFSIYSIFRHSVTHNNAIIEINKLRGFSNQKKELLKYYFGISDLYSSDTQFQIFDCSKNALDIVKRTMEYAYLISYSFENT